MGVELGAMIQEGQMGIVENPEPPPPGTKPAFQPLPPLNEADVRAAVMAAEREGEDPTKLKFSAVAQIADPEQPPQAAKAEPPLEVPEKFKKSNGEVDVEKLNASTKQLDEHIQQKEQALKELQQQAPQDVNKFVEEALKKYKEREAYNRSLPNPNRVAAAIPPIAMIPPAIPATPQEMSDEQLEAIINQDLAQNPARTIAKLFRTAIQRELSPLNEERQETKVRTHLKELADRDPRSVAHLEAIHAKLDSTPELWSLPNPYKVAWLEVKEDLRLGDPSTAQAQPRTPPAPVLAGGTPPPTPSSSTGQVDVNSVLAASKQISGDQRNKRQFDKNQWDKMDAIARQLFK